MTDMRRTLLWVVFSMSLVLLWDAWGKHNGKPSMFGGPVATQSAPATPGAVPTSGVPAAAVAAAPGAAPVTPAVVAASTSEKVDISTDLVKASFDTRGGDLVRLELLKYTDNADPTRNVVLFDRSASRVYLGQTGLIPAAGAAALPNHQTIMALVPGERTLKDGTDSLTLRFESPEVGGVKLAKTYTFKRGDYVVGVKHEVFNQSGAAVSPQLYLQLVRDGNPPPGESSFYSTFTGPAVYTDASKYKKIEFSKIEKGSVEIDKTADNGWVGMVQHYFVSAWLPADKAQRELFARKVDTNLYAVGSVLPLGSIAPGTSVTQEARLFAGPQEETKLAALAPGLELVKDYGWLTILSKPLFWLLTQLHKLLGNWGWSIIGLVVLLKAAFFYLNASAYKSMAKMKAINPRVTELRERLKDKPQEMQQEMMRIYREEKVNPIGGCLPIFIQMPFFIALYWVLLSTVEMRNAPWIGWITDLSQPDTLFGVLPVLHTPIGLLPILMTASSLLQTWLNPTPPDPVQAKMMWIMPLVFSLMFFSFPAGLVLYWLTNNLLSIAQQYVINKKLGVLGK
jgi:YidC/Oxa1 family membrane protein insertase